MQSIISPACIHFLFEWFILRHPLYSNLDIPLSVSLASSPVFSHLLNPNGKMSSILSVFKSTTAIALFSLQNTDKNHLYLLQYIQSHIEQYNEFKSVQHISEIIVFHQM